MQSQGSFYIQKNADGELRALAITKMWVERDAYAYRLCGTTEDGYVINLHQDESLKEVNRQLLLRAGIDPILIAAMEVSDEEKDKE